MLVLGLRGATQCARAAFSCALVGALPEACDLMPFRSRHCFTLEVSVDVGAGGALAVELLPAEPPPLEVVLEWPVPVCFDWVDPAALVPVDPVVVVAVVAPPEALVEVLGFEATLVLGDLELPHATRTTVHSASSAARGTVVRRFLTADGRDIAIGGYPPPGGSRRGADMIHAPDNPHLRTGRPGSAGQGSPPRTANSYADAPGAPARNRCSPAP